MAQQIMWDHIGEQYRGQAEDHTLITIDREALETALKRAGNSVFEADWWNETLSSVLARWGIYGKRSVDEVTRVPRVHFIVGEPRFDTGTPPTSSGPLSTRILNSGNLSTRQLPEDKNKRD